MLFFRGHESDYQHPCRGLTTICNSSFRESDDSGLLNHLHPCVYPLKHIYIHIIEKQIFFKKKMRPCKWGQGTRSMRAWEMLRLNRKGLTHTQGVLSELKTRAGQCPSSSPTPYPQPSVIHTNLSMLPGVLLRGQHDLAFRHDVYDTVLGKNAHPAELDVLGICWPYQCVLLRKK